ncbi:TPA: peptidoglycan-binding protein, partial [Klebsiella pneumoniae]
SGSSECILTTMHVKQWGAGQFALLDRGYYNGNIDGIMGPSTRQSIKNYRIANGLPTPATQTLDTQLLNSLNILAR